MTRHAITGSFWNGLEQGWVWIQRHLLAWSAAEQLAFVIVAFLIVLPVGRRLARQYSDHMARKPPGHGAEMWVMAVRFAPWIVLLLVLEGGSVGFQQASQPDDVLRLAVSLTLAWIVIRLSSGLIRDQTLSRAVAILGWLIAALNIAGLIQPTIGLLDSMALMVGHLRLSLYLVIKGAFALGLLLWLASLLSRVTEQRLRTLPHMSPAMQVLIAKLTRITLLTLAVVLALGSVGIDLTAFAVFSGAVGVGIGFGLQKVVSNLISGVILLLDRSIKPGDVIQIDNTYGWINQLNARYASVSTRDGTEYLIPNEDLITQRVINWSYSNDLVRLHVNVGISYEADLHRAIEVCIEAAAKAPRVLADPRPTCLVLDFGDSTIDLQIRFWIADPRGGTANIRSEVMVNVWDAFKREGLEFPFPQRDVTLRNPGALEQVIERVLARRAGIDAETLPILRNGIEPS